MEGRGRLRATVRNSFISLPGGRTPAPARGRDQGLMMRSAAFGVSRSSPRPGRGARSSAVLVLLALGACSPPAPRELAAWDRSDEGNRARIDHGAWQEILEAYVAADPSGVHLVDYAGLAGNEAERTRLDGYVGSLEAVDPREYSRAEQMAYWINFYNALTVKVVVDAYPVDSIRDIHEGVVPYTGPWDDAHARVAGQDLTLNDMEHGILRPIWQDPRIHYAVNCAALSCPNLLLTAFTAENTEALLEAGAVAYVNSTRGVDVVDEDLIILSSIYDWYAVDFGETEADVIAHLQVYADDELGAFLADFGGAIDYDYDWTLNRQAP